MAEAKPDTALATLRAINVDDLSALNTLDLSSATALRAIAQQMGWMVDTGGAIEAAATAHLADGTVFIDSLVGTSSGRGKLIDHVLAYAKWSDAPAVTLAQQTVQPSLSQRGFIVLDSAALPPELAKARGDQTLLIKRV